MTIDVAIARAEHVPGLLALFEACASSCYCRYWHFTGTKNEWLDRCAHRPEENARELEDAVRTDDPTGRGLVALRAGAVVGWMKLTARVALPKLRALPVYRSLSLPDGATTFSIACLLVRPDLRRRGVARALVGAAGTLAHAWGAAAVEGYPRRSTDPLHDEEAWQGPERVFVEAAFEPVHDAGPYPVYRKPVARR